MNSVQSDKILVLADAHPSPNGWGGDGQLVTIPPRAGGGTVIPRGGGGQGGKEGRMN